MDEALLKSGQFPNVAIMAGTDPKEVMREHGQTGTEHMDNGVSVHMCPNDTGAHSNVTQILSDTRDRLEADIQLSAMHLEFDDGYRSAEKVLDMVPLSTVYGWLDRQDAITRRECKRENIEWQQELIDNLNELDNTAELIDELTAERDSLRLDVAALYDMCDECKLVASLTAERDQLSRDLTAEHALVVQFEHDNEKLKADLKTANDTINTLRASVAGLKETVEKLEARNE